MADSLTDYTELYFATPYTEGDLTLDLIAKNDLYKLTDHKTSSLITEFYGVGKDRDSKTKFMGFKISNVVENGTVQGATRYTATIATSDGSNPMVALANTYDGTTADANIIDALKISLKAGSLLLVSVGSGILRMLDTAFESATTTQTITLGSGEAFAIRSQLSLHTDGKYYKYHATNYPNWIGTAGTAATAADESFTLRKAGYLVPGYAGLTIGADQYAENTGATTETASATTKFIGNAESVTEIRLKSTEPADTQLTQDNVEDYTSTAFGTVSGQRLGQSQQKSLVSYAADAEASDTYVITLSPISISLIFFVPISVEIIVFGDTHPPYP